MRVKRKYHLALQVCRAGLDHAHNRITVFHGEGEIAAHERCPHAIEFTCRYVSGQNKPLRTPA